MCWHFPDSLCLLLCPRGCWVAGGLAGEWLHVVTGRRQLRLQACLSRLMEGGLAGLVALQPWSCWCSCVHGVCWG